MVLACSVVWAKPRVPATTRAEAVPSQDSVTLAFPGVQGPVPYDSYGQFEDTGTPRYRYAMKDRAGLAKAVGEGIYPNVTGLLVKAWGEGVGLVDGHAARSLHRRSGRGGGAKRHRRHRRRPRALG